MSIGLMTVLLEPILVVRSPLASNDLTIPAIAVPSSCDAFFAPSPSNIKATKQSVFRVARF